MTHETMHDVGDNATFAPVSRGSTWLSSFGCGVMFGAALGILFAPARGRDTRQGIATATRDGRARAASMIGRCRSALATRQAQASELVHTAGDHVRSAAGTIAHKGQTVRSFVSQKKEPTHL